MNNINNTHDPLISIIVPVYKVEPYLDKCVQSIVDQTYTNLEIILVDDGSPDNCPAMCDAWAKRDSRIKVVHKENGGLSDARNAGLEIATGEYIGFIDSDDYIAPLFVETLIGAIQKYDVKLAACNYEVVSEDVELNNKRYDIPAERILDTAEALASLTKGEKIKAVVWNKLYHSSLFSINRFEKGKYHEDEFLTYKLIDKCSFLSYSDAKLYYYRQRQGSIMSFNSIQHLDYLEAHKERLKLFKSNYPAIYRYDKVAFCTACVGAYGNTFCDSYGKKRQARRAIRRYRRQISFSIKELIGYSIKQLAYIVLSLDPLIHFFAWYRHLGDKK